MAKPHHALIAFLPLFAAACSTIPMAPKGSDRVELEVAIELGKGFRDKLQVDEPEIERRIAEQALGHADLGLRFYPVLTKDYESDNNRPEFLLTIEVRDLDVELGKRTVHREERDPEVQTFVERLDCAVSTLLVKRRKTGPPLTVAHTTGRGAAQPTGRAPGGAKEAETRAPEMTVLIDDVLRAADGGLRQALGGLIIPVDRELSLRQARGAKVRKGKANIAASKGPKRQTRAGPKTAATPR
ncbi:MAG: hypothetical protein AAF628_36590 [Planctomycetota bacterium]